MKTENEMPTAGTVGTQERLGNDSTPSLPSPAQIVNTLPADLAAHPAWLVWRREERAGKTTKIPYQPREGDRKAKTNESKTWGSFADACAQVHRFDGLGVILREGLVGVDLDHVVDPATGNLSPMAREIVDLLDSYTEFSPSGTGLHILCRGDLPAGKRRRGQVEAYDESSPRFFTVTGQPLPGSPSDVAQRTVELAAFHKAYLADPQPQAPPATPKNSSSSPTKASDEERLAAAFAAANGAETRRLFNEPGGDGGSEGDAALAHRLAFFSDGDPATLDRLLRASSRVRAKWDSPRPGGSWLACEVARAIAACGGEFWKPRRQKKRAADVVATVASGLNSGALSPRSAPGTGPDDPDPGDDLLQFNTTDAGNGEAFAHLFGDDLRFDWTRERWLRWAGHLWAPADYGHLTELTKTAARRRYMQASHAGDRGEQQRKHAFRSEARGRVEAALFFARAEDPITDPGDGWDVDPWLIGCANGVFDIRTGEFRAGRRDDRLTMQAGVSFDPAAECPLWHSFLRDVFNGDRELIDYVHRAIGYSLTGSVRDDCFFVCYGSGANGKSVFSEVLRIAFGDYGHHAPFDLFDYSCRNQHPQGLALLEGRRFVTALEAAPGARLNEQRVKSLAGGDPITAHLMRENDRTFTCTSHLWLLVNHRPRVLDDSPGFWRKARMIPFNRRFVPQEQIDRNPELRDDLGVLPADEKLRPRLLSEAAGILRWAAEGAHLWATEGIQTPACVVAGSEAWRDEADPIGEFLRCFCVTGPDLRTPAGALWAAYEMFVTHEGVPARERLTNTAFGRLMGARFNRVRAQWGGKLQRMYTGVALRADKEAEE